MDALAFDSKGWKLPRLSHYLHNQTIGPRLRFADPLYNRQERFMSADCTPTTGQAKRHPTHSRLWIVVMLGLGLGGLGVFGENVPSLTRVEWSQVKFFAYPGNWPIWVSQVLWIAVAGLSIEFVVRLRKTRAIASQAGSWFLKKFPVDPALAEMFTRRWDTKWIFKAGRWLYSPTANQRFALLIRSAIILVVLYISCCHIKDVNAWETFQDLALDYPLQPFQQWYDAICCFTGRGVFTWKVLIVPVMGILFWAWVFSLRRDYYRLLQKTKDDERGINNYGS